MVSKTLVTLALAAAVQAQSNLVPISYESTLETYYYFRDGEGSVTVNADGVLVDADCDSLATAQIVYSADDAEDVLLAANCYDVFYLVTPEDQAITWTSCVEFPFYQALCEAGVSSTASSAASVTEASTGVVSSSAYTVPTSLPSTTVSNDETYVLTTVTSYESNEVTLYTTYCPLTAAEAASSSATHSVVGAPDYTVVQVSATTFATVGADGSMTSVTSLIQVTPEAAPSTTVVTITSCSDNKCSVIPVTTGITVVTTMEAGVITEYTTYCPLSTEEASAAASTEAATTSAATAAPAGTTVELASASSTTAAEETSIAVSTFEGAGAKLAGSVSVGVIVAVVGLFM